MNSYTREEAMQFLIERLDGKWPTDISDAPLCPGWGWCIGWNNWVVFNAHASSASIVQEEYVRTPINRHHAATAQQPAPNGQKFDADKVILGAIPPNAELAVGRVLTFGAKKYARDNWRIVDNLQERYMDAALRHLNAVRRGETVDAESGESHLAHAACCILFMLDVQESKQ